MILDRLIFWARFTTVLGEPSGPPVTHKIVESNFRVVDNNKQFLLLNNSDGRDIKGGMIKISTVGMQFILCGLLGWVSEVVFTGITDPFKNKRFSLTSTTYLWMFPIYGLLAFCYPPIHDIIRNYDWFVRGFIYMIAFFAVEYVTGWILKKVTGDFVWQYTSRFNLHGLIQLPHAPVWFFAGLGFEKIYPYIVRLSKVSFL